MKGELQEANQHYETAIKRSLQPDYLLIKNYDKLVTMMKHKINGGGEKFWIKNKITLEKEIGDAKVVNILEKKVSKKLIIDEKSIDKKNNDVIINHKNRTVKRLTKKDFQMHVFKKNNLINNSIEGGLLGMMFASSECIIYAWGYEYIET